MQGLESILTSQGRKKMWLARETGVSIRTLTRYLNGQTEPPLTWIEAAARVLGCDAEDLLPTESDRTSAEALAVKAGERVAR